MQGTVPYVNFHNPVNSISSQTPIRIPPTPWLDSVSNFRDVAIGNNTTPYRTTDGKTLHQGLIYRSNTLTPSEEDLAILNTLGIGTVYDLRTPTEINEKPDSLLTGATYININVLNSIDSPKPSGITSPEMSITFMEKLNRDCITDVNQRAKFAELFKEIAASDTVQLFHCSGGKDRTGWAAAVLLSLLDVPKDVIIDDYMLTNIYGASTISATYEDLVTTRGKNVADIYFPALGVQQSFLEASVDQVLKDYGSMADYINIGLGLDTNTQSKLREKLLY